MVQGEFVLKDTIVYYGGFSLPDKNAAANRVVSNGKIFKALGYNVVFLGAEYDNGNYAGVKSLGDGMMCEAHPSGVIDWVKQILLFKNLKKVIEKASAVKLVILYNVPFVTLCLAKGFFKKDGIEVAYDCTEWTQFTDGSFVKKIFKYIDEFFIRKFAHRIADKMIVVSETMLKAYKGKKKIIKLPPLIDLSDDIWHQPIEKEEGGFTFCFAGFPDGNKDYIGTVVEAFSLLECNNVNLKIVGITKDKFLEMYKNISIGENIDFFGKLTHSEAVKQILLSDCYVFIRPSDRRNNAGFPTKFVESYSCGVKIITTDVSDVRMYAEAECDILPCNDVNELRVAMTNAISSTPKREQILLRDTFDYKNYIDETQRWLN